MLPSAHSLFRGFTVLLVLTALLLAGCSPTAKDTDLSTRKINVVTTVGMINDIVKNVGGDRVQTQALMGPGVDPHLYRATASDVTKLDKADIVFYGGLELEGRMTDVFVKMARNGTPTHPVTETIPPDRLREPPEFEGKYDPHVWFDLTLWKHAVEAVRDALVDLDPASKDLYTTNAETYLAEIDDLHSYTQQQVATIPEDQRVLITAHDAFGYFGDQYGFQVLGIQGTSTATEAAASTVIDLADLIAARKIKAVFVESSVPRSTVEALQQAVQSRGWNVQIGGELFSDAMGQDGTEEGTYLGMVRHNVDTIVEALK